MNFNKPPFKDHPLSHIIAALGAKTLVLSKSRHEYLSKEAERKHFEARLVTAGFGKSQGERVTEAHASLEWSEFHKELARLEAIFEFHKLELEVLNKEYFAQLAELKMDDALIKKQE